MVIVAGHCNKVQNMALKY